MSNITQLLTDRVKFSTQAAFLIPGKGYRLRFSILHKRARANRKLPNVHIFYKFIFYQKRF